MERPMNVPPKKPEFELSHYIEQERRYMEAFQNRMMLARNSALCGHLLVIGAFIVNFYGVFFMRNPNAIVGAVAAIVAVTAAWMQQGFYEAGKNGGQMLCLLVAMLGTILSWGFALMLALRATGMI